LRLQPRDHQSRLQLGLHLKDATGVPLAFKRCLTERLAIALGCSLHVAPGPLSGRAQLDRYSDCTLDCYSHAIPSMQEDAAERIAALLE
jgi:hypothetical protein